MLGVGVAIPVCLAVLCPKRMNGWTALSAQLLGDLMRLEHYYPNEVNIYALEAEALADFLPYLNMEMAKEFYVYGLDTNDGCIANALLCPDELRAVWVYQEAMQQVDVERLSGQFQFGYIGIGSCAAIEYMRGGVRKIGVFKQEDFAFAASLTKKPVLIGKKHHHIANDLSDFMLRADAILEDWIASDKEAKECFALVFDSSRCDSLRPLDDARILQEVEAVISVGKLTVKQYRRLDREFDERYTGTKNVDFVLEGGAYAHILSDVPKDIMCNITDYPPNEYLREQNDLLKAILVTLNDLRADKADIVKALNEHTAIEKEIVSAIKENTASRGFDTFWGAFRAMARFFKPKTITEIERLRCLIDDGWEWKVAIMDVFPATAEEDVDSEVNKWQHRLATYRKSPKKRKI